MLESMSFIFEPVDSNGASLCKDPALPGGRGSVAHGIY